MKRETAINLILVGLPDADAQALVSTFRRAGKVAHPQSIQNSEQLSEILRRENGDLLFFNAAHAPFSIAQCGQILRHENADLPLIYLHDDEAALPPDESISITLSTHNVQRLFFYAQRELQALQTRRELRQLETELDEERQRNALLLSNHQDAVTYITDGMIIYANEIFCQRLGHEELDGFPIVDLISNKDQERFKSALKKLQKGKDATHLELSFVHADGSEQHYSVACDSASYDGEACIQLTVQEDNGALSSGLLDATTGLANRVYFHQLLQDFVDQHRDSNSSLILIAVDRFSELRRDLGLCDAEDFIKLLTNHIQTHLPAQHYGRVGDDLIGVIAHHVPTSRALDLATELLQSVEGEIFELRKQSQQCTLSASILPINHLTSPDVRSLLDSCFIGIQRISDSGGNTAEVYTKERQDLVNSSSIGEVVNEAFADNRLQLLFQPIINLSDAYGDHYEAFLDVKDWREGEVSAGEMLRVIEQEPLNNKLDRWIVVETTKQLAKKRQSGEEIKLIINLSGNVFHDTEFCSWLSVAMKAAGLPGSALSLQFSEESIAKALKPALDCYRQLQHLGVEMAVRNFGRSKGGNKFLSHIRPCMVKPGVRKSDTLNSEQIRDIINGARQFNSRVLIPNVSSAANLAILWQLGPDFIQGSYVQDPTPEMGYEFAAFS
ncbi:EAL domain-containing protein [Spongiibacter sp. KMU-166]|uniref:EAL domain-containing protein n=1 Tax=Spongiibacter thalassae TaxID=2721624 RepID=A0ABX1GIS5_9GAMM|nr:EAL domain-containing protein [Spongiibacter thalassae]NKI19071.1 EAL domain-containing protein [Spongiibacter thalassae]